MGDQGGHLTEFLHHSNFAIFKSQNGPASDNLGSKVAISFVSHNIPTPKFKSREG
jgi:hypothetical protein